MARNRDTADDPETGGTDELGHEAGGTDILGPQPG